MREWHQSIVFVQDFQMLGSRASLTYQYDFEVYLRYPALQLYEEIDRMGIYSHLFCTRVTQNLVID